ncbi:pentatricopeptide repeat-containing protein At5g16860-like [Selaginella moellendorffii]|uniref:pentatricopeptide repeat-containing protein At5g16860-like n=1 Tax=Selaginella moellendorffii TaxID=88036 RepID=UPI000D1C8829|nr:pentatricopeptide repeat-containing protein At5g16860-like [Selaginella moellendorffii]|eukprot:XP_024542479.1 pentatricopeptide repeat-containing protein At5g16860-like [Selaginella moellendorffii]
MLRSRSNARVGWIVFVLVRRFISPPAGQSEVSRVVAALKSCKDLDIGRRIHRDAAGRGLDTNVYVAGSLVSMYAKHGSMVDAQRVFDRMARPDVVSWNSLIFGYANNGHGGMALDSFGLMQRKGFVPNARTFVAALKACSALASQEQGQELGGKALKIGSLQKGLTIYDQAVKIGCDSDIFVPNAAVDLFAKCGSLKEARRVFDGMTQRDVVTWNSVMVGHGDNGEPESALELFQEMKARGCQPNARSYVAAVKACTSLASKEEAVRLSGKHEVKVRSLERGMAIHAEAAKGGLELEYFVANTLVDFYVKCGSSADARRVFDKMPLHDVVSWTALVLGYAENGEGKVALDLFEDMQRRGCTPNAWTFLAALKACSCVVAVEYVKAVLADIYSSSLTHSAKQTPSPGLRSYLDTLRKGTQRTPLFFSRRCETKGKRYFEMMSTDYGLTPGIQHYTCMVDILARANELDAAVAMVKTMPFEADSVTWRTVLSSCRKWKNLEKGKVAFEALVKLEEGDVSAYMLMGSIYGSQGMWEEQSRVEAMRTRARAWKKFEPAQSWWVDPAGRVHSFLAAGEKNHPQRDEIQAKLSSLVLRMKDQGYVPDFGSLNNASSRISSEEKEDALCGHSERLAIACALINTAPGATIRVTKNLRVCDDCHRAIGLISKIEQRAIICRDASRFHSYKDGACSCNDHW